MHVVGDLDDLLPAAAAPDETSGSTPTGCPPKKQLDAALDALAAMTREAARRPDPDQQLVAKVGAQTARRRTSDDR